MRSAGQCRAAGELVARFSPLARQPFGEFAPSATPGAHS
jgi:hypothetical protein